jgi:diacylglycerol kinase family enzyme
VSGDPVTIIVNDASGSAVSGFAELEAALIRTRLGARVVRVRGPQIVQQANEAARPGTTVVAAGGDGTVSTVAAAAVRNRAVLGIIPLGTLNHFARDCGIPQDVEKALAVIVERHERRVQVGAVNGHFFVNNASLGLYPRMVWEREMERRRGRRKWTAFVIALVRTWRRYPTVKVRVAVDTVAMVRRTPFVFIGNGEYRVEGFGLGTRASLDTNTLSIFLAPDADRYEMLALPFRALAGRLGGDVKFESLRVTEVTIDTGHRGVDVALDGELRVVSPPINCATHPRALRVLVPKDV